MKQWKIAPKEGVRFPMDLVTGLVERGLIAVETIPATDHFCQLSRHHTNIIQDIMPQGKGIVYETPNSIKVRQRECTITQQEQSHPTVKSVGLGARQSTVLQDLIDKVYRASSEKSVLML
jgi:hypothetical protein